MRSRFYSNTVLFLSSVWLSAVLTACAGGAGSSRSEKQEPVAPRESDAGPQAECLPVFPDHNGWYGADAAYSVPLPSDDERTSLWLFGDTFVQRPGLRQGRAYPFIHNSIGISVCGLGGHWHLETFWRRSPGTRPEAFFVPARDAEWAQEARVTTGAPPYYWPFDGFIAHDTLFVALLRVVESPPRGPFNLPFRLAGVDLARIENFGDAPEDWQIQVSTLSNNTTAFPASTFVETGSHVYVFAFFDKANGESHRMLSRLDLESLRKWQSDLSESLETWTQDGSWKDGFTPDRAMILMDDDTSEMSVHFDLEREGWLAVYTDPTRDRRSGGPSFVRSRYARDLVGPWSKPERLSPIPETVSNQREDNLFCYAGKAHPQFSSPNDLIVTYVCSLFANESSKSMKTLEELLDRPTLYRPRALSIKLPAALDFEVQKTE